MKKVLDLIFLILNTGIHGDKLFLKTLLLTLKNNYQMENKALSEQIKKEGTHDVIIDFIGCIEHFTSVR